ncbi:Release factor H-coupled R [Mycena kentingensis (nom. inval.)]|nr:Release factor H-coupled R [Mycena kentingensis (nom. inval.)]
MNIHLNSGVHEKIHKLRGEHFRHQLNQNRIPRVAVQNRAPTLPGNLFSGTAYAKDKPSAVRTTREALFVCKPFDDRKTGPTASGARLISAAERASVLSLVLENDLEPPRVPRLTLLCLQSLLMSCSDAEFKQAVSYIPAHLRVDLMRWAAVSRPLTTQQLRVLCGGNATEGRIVSELIVVGPEAHLLDADLRTPAQTQTDDDWDSEERKDPPSMQTLVFISTPVTFSLLLAVPPTVTRLGLVNLPNPVSLHRLTATCPLLECFDLSHNAWLATENEATEHLGKIIWTRLQYLRLLGLRDCFLLPELNADVNKGKWHAVEILQ